MAAATDLEFSDIKQENRGALDEGRLKIHKNGLIFKTARTGKVDQLAASEIDSISWLRVACGHELKFLMKNGGMHRFDGFKESDYDKVHNFIKMNFDIEVEPKHLCVKGWNWGQAKFNGNVLTFDIDEKPTFDIPLSYVMKSTTSKNECTIEFHQNDDASVNLMEMRFYIPSGPEGSVDTVKAFHNNIMAKADIIQATGDAIVSFEQLYCLTPRGRYDVKLYQSFIQLHGKTFDFKIPYATILRLFLLPHLDGRQMFFVVSLDPPIKQGQTRYHFLILLFNKEDTVSVELSPSEDKLAEDFDGKLTKEMNGPVFEIVSRIMKALTSKKISVPGSFKSNSKDSSISCAYKAASGFIYPLDRGFIYVHKPPIHVRFDEISSVNFARGSGSTRYFDFEIDTRGGTSYTFSNINKDEYTQLYDFINSKGLKIKNRGEKGQRKQKVDDDMMDSDDDNHDAYLEQVKAEGMERADADDDSESEGSSFVPGDESDVALEFDSDAHSSSEEGGSAGSGGDAKKQKLEKKPKEPKKKSKPKEPRAKRRTKTVKDKNAPKRPMSGYLLWMNDKREGWKAENPGASVTEISKIAGENWKKIDPDEKKKYEKLATEAKARYEIEKAEYDKKKAEEPSPDENEESGSEKKKKKAPKAAKSKPEKTKVSPRKDLNKEYKSKEYISTSEESDRDESSPKKSTEKKKESESDNENDAAGGSDDAAGGSDDAAGGSDDAAGGSEDAKSSTKEESEKSGSEDEGQQTSGSASE